MSLRFLVDRCLGVIDDVSFTTEDVDHVLYSGDQLYRQIAEERDVQYLLVEEIPDVITVDNERLDITKHQPYSGTLEVTESNNDSLVYALPEALANAVERSQYLFVTIGSSPGYTSAFFYKGDGTFLCFDSHSRNSSGESSPSGRAVIMKIESLEAAVSYTKDLAKSLNQTTACFEITPTGISRSLIQSPDRRDADDHPMRQHNSPVSANSTPGSRNEEGLSSEEDSVLGENQTSDESDGSQSPPKRSRPTLEESDAEGMADPTDNMEPSQHDSNTADEDRETQMLVSVRPCTTLANVWERVNDDSKYKLIKDRIPPASYIFPCKEYPDKAKKSGVRKRSCQHKWFTQLNTSLIVERKWSLLSGMCPVPVENRTSCRAQFLINKSYTTGRMH
ncbi:hypothetical protein BSL78_29539 [Apostichopus japonicus]|uniref:Uncharacterized protein n=1 Tax=Stichopus japonicus TaxID=307972 RepID=A0A2G8JD39_STIJA|nr:hypothetical protein BSL78_29539 [Apostichopus japonicus]